MRDYRFRSVSHQLRAKPSHGDATVRAIGSCEVLPCILQPFHAASLCSGNSSRGCRRTLYQKIHNASDRSPGELAREQRGRRHRYVAWRAPNKNGPLRRQWGKCGARLHYSLWERASENLAICEASHRYCEPASARRLPECASEASFGLRNVGRPQTEARAGGTGKRPMTR